jgi:hypothetical protein
MGSLNSGKASHKFLKEKHFWQSIHRGFNRHSWNSPKDCLGAASTSAERTARAD